MKNQKNGKIKTFFKKILAFTLATIIGVSAGESLIQKEDYGLEQVYAEGDTTHQAIAEEKWRTRINKVFVK